MSLDSEGGDHWSDTRALRGALGELAKSGAADGRFGGELGTGMADAGVAGGEATTGGIGKGRWPAGPTGNDSPKGRHVPGGYRESALDVSGTSDVGLRTHQAATNPTAISAMAIAVREPALPPEAVRPWIVTRVTLSIRSKATEELTVVFYRDAVRRDDSLTLSGHVTLDENEGSGRARRCAWRSSDDCDGRVKPQASDGCVLWFERRA